MIGRSVGLAIGTLAPSLMLLLEGVICGCVWVTTRGEVERMKTVAEPTVLDDWVGVASDVAGREVVT